VSLAGEAPVVQAEPPVQPPAGFQAPGNQPPLAQIAAAPVVERDPRTPFSAATATLTAGPRLPTEPFHVVSATPAVQASPAVGTSPLVTAPLGTTARGTPPAAPVPVVRPVAPGEVLTAAYPPLLISLIVLGFVAGSSPVFAVVLLAAAPVFFVPHVHYRVTQLRVASFVILAVLLLVWLVSTILAATTYNVDLRLPLWAMAGCWLLAGLDLLFQWAGLRHGEPRHQPGRN